MTRSAWKIAVLVMISLLAGCASGPKPLPQCVGPWDPVNAVIGVRHGQ
jgi:hypothetical protein